MRKILVFIFCILIVFVGFGCAPKGYRMAVNRGVRLENQKDYERAYAAYQQALQLKPDDAEIKRKLDALGSTIAGRLTEDAAQAFDNNRHRTSLALLDKALRYDHDHQKANAYKKEVGAAYENIKDKYAQVEGFRKENKWVVAFNTLNEISEMYADDPELEKRIKDVREAGYPYLKEAAKGAKAKGEYSRSLNYLESAAVLRSGDEIQQKIKTAEKYIQADGLYARAEAAAHQEHIMAAMDVLIQSKDLVQDHIRINQLIDQLTPEWSPLIFDKAKAAMSSGHIEDAYDAFKKLKLINSAYPKVDQRLEGIKPVYLQRTYKRLVDAQNAEDFSAILALSHRIMEEEPGYLDTRDIRVRAVQKAFNLFFQQGLAYMKSKNYGKAVLCFRSAERQLSETRLTRKRIDEAWQEIRKGSAFRGVLVKFSQEIGDPSISDYLTLRLREQLKKELGREEFKNVYVDFRAEDDRPLVTRGILTTHLDWGSILSKGFNAVITGKVILLKQDTAMNSEWKTRRRVVRKIVDNKEYTRMLMRRAELKTGLGSKSWRKENRMGIGDIEEALDRLEQRLATIPPKIEADVAEETPYQVVKHQMTAHMQMDVEVLAPDGSHVWPMKHYEDTFQIEDSVVPPNLKSDDPKERKGDPLTLPSESEFKQQAIDNIVKNKIVPDLIVDFSEYGIRFYMRADELNKRGKPSNGVTIDFLDSFEEYYRFLASYEGNGKADALRDEVEKKLDSHIGAAWLIRR